jgi:hypothetical protein
MAKVRFAARIGAAAFLAGASLAVPQSIAIASADRTTTSSDTASSASSDSPGTGRPPRGGTLGSRGGDPVSAPRAAAARAAGETRGTAGPGRSRPATDNLPEAPQPSPKASAQTPTTAAAAVASTAEIAAPAEAAPTPPTPAATVSVSPETRVAAPVVTVTEAPAPAAVATAAPAPAGSLATATASASASANANASTAALIDRLLAPITKLFGEGTALMIRRSLFNQAPTVNPVQLTGQSDGPITGSIGAVDPEGDPLSYKITSAPLHGKAVIASDGSYTYTPTAGFAGTDNFVVAVTDGGSHFNLLDLGRQASTSANVTVNQGAIAPLVHFQFVYGSGSQYWSSAARSSLESAATRLASYIVVTSPVTVTFDVTGQKSPFSSTLASAGSDFVSGDAGFLQTVVQNKILTGNDANGSAADGTIDWNFGLAWGYGNSVTSNQYDLESIAMHEMLHTLGFLSNIDKAGSNTGKVWTVFDKYVVNSAQQPVINNSSYVFNTAYNSNLTGGNDGLYFGGPNAVAANGGPVALYTPLPWEPGSSMSHLRANYLMRAVVSTGPGFRDVSPVELAILSDIGYTVNGSPVFLFVGFIALRLRRRND